MNSSQQPHPPVPDPAPHNPRQYAQPQLHWPQQPMSPVHDQSVPQKRKNPLGTASLWIGIFAPFVTIGLIMLRSPRDLTGIDPVNFAYPVVVIGAALGIIALFRKHSHKKAAIWGIILNVLGVPLGFLLVHLFIIV
ncbi:MAG: hypothetical protein Q4C71_05015, partial [Microbacteriaceae bacterium]|nr:hypothetical protein [Microbacteriaceae bacterium]